MHLRLSNVMLAILLLVTVLGARRVAQVPAAHAQAGLPALPAGWPSTLQLGRGRRPRWSCLDEGEGAVRLPLPVPLGRLNTGNGWRHWQGANEAPGMFVTRYIDESAAQGITPVFTYYMIYQSLPGGGSEQQAVLTNLNNTATMQAYWADLKLFFQTAGARPNKKVVFHAEPDMWGYVQQAAGNDNAASVAAKVHATGVPEVAGLPGNVAGLAQGIVRLRNQYAPNVFLGYQVSVWGTGVDIALSDPSDSQVDALGNRAGAFYTSLGAAFDVAFGEFSDRDSAYMVIYPVQGAAVLVERRGLPAPCAVHLPLRGHQRQADGHVADPARQHQDAGDEQHEPPLPGQPRRVAAGRAGPHPPDGVRQRRVIGFMFGGGNGEVTCACDAAGDGTTNPAPINGNNTLSYTADDDGGFFHNRAAAYYATGVMGLPAAQPPRLPRPPRPRVPRHPHAAPPPVACSPRPPVQVSTTRGRWRPPGQRHGDRPEQPVQAIEVSRTNNALVDIGGQVGRTGAFSVGLPGTSASTSFTYGGRAPAGDGQPGRRGSLRPLDHLRGGGPNAF